MRQIPGLVGLIFVAACGGGGTDPASVDAPGADASTFDTWQPLIHKAWSLAAGEEKTSDLTIDSTDRDIYVGGMRPLAPQGTHHTLLYKGVQGTNMIYASGVGTGELRFPPGLGFKIDAGTALGLQLHIYNTTEGTLSGTSGVEFYEVDPASVTDEVDLFLPGSTDFSLPAMQESTVTSTCTVTQPYKVFALFPHMHQLGTHFKTTLTINGQERVLHDADYNFEHQDVITFDAIQLNVGDKITSTCTWNNTTDHAVSVGESSDTEMCFSILYRYPRGAEEFCTH